MGRYLRFLCSHPLSSIKYVTFTSALDKLLMSFQLGFKATPANLLSVPVYAWACIVTVAVGFLGDRIGHRAIINL